MAPSDRAAADRATSRSLRVVINARLPQSGMWGGVEQFVVRLIDALGQLADDPERYVVLVSPEAADLLAPRLGPNQELARAPALAESQALPRKVRGLATALRGVARRLGSPPLVLGGSQRRHENGHRPACQRGRCRWSSDPMIALVRASSIVAIEAQITPDGKWGGVEQFVRGLVQSLGRLTDGAERYLIVVPPEHPHWLDSYLGPNQQVVIPPTVKSRFGPLKKALGPLQEPATAVWRAANRFGKPAPQLPESGGFVESLGAEVVHFPHQAFARLRVPTIFNPHDLQHRHFPEFFARREVATRDATYRAACEHARVVAAESHFVKRDLVRQFGVDPKRVFVVRRGAPTELSAAIDEPTLAFVRRKFHLPETFALYPAQTWPHKNHVRLLEALEILRARDSVTLTVICTGHKNENWPVIERELRRRRLSEQAIFPGYISAVELKALYRLARFLVFPSLFEGGGFPVVEAFSEDLPITCSALDPLEEYAGDAALFFDPTSPPAIADALLRMTTDGELRRRLCARGRERVRSFTWEKTARTYRALYRLVAGRGVTDEDRALLAEAAAEPVG